MNKTIDYYEKNADRFTAETQSVDFEELQERFLRLINEAGKILDFGCGSGRDTKYFISKGYTVDAIDGSERICHIATQKTGIEVRQMFFSELDVEETYDGIWACASILHLPKDELRDVICKMIRATKNGGYIYTSFKYGDFEGYRNGRYFKDFTESSFEGFIEGFSGAEIVEKWISLDVRPGRGDEKWLNIILQKN